MKIKNLNVSFGETVIFENFNIDFDPMAITVILGPSGCGKTTLLNSIAFNKKNKVSYIFQEPRLIPWFTIEKNLCLVLKQNQKQNKITAQKYLERVGLLNKKNSYPNTLSGGEKQRVSIARAFSNKSPVLLMDEPFQSQDIKLKSELISLVKKLQTEEKRTIIAVTHDIYEAKLLAQRALVLCGRPVFIKTDIKNNDDLFIENLSKALDCTK